MRSLKRMHATNARACATNARARATSEKARANLKNSDRKVSQTARVQIVKRA